MKRNQLDEQIKLKKSEARAAWEAYIEAVNSAEQNRSTLRQARELLFKKRTEGSRLDQAALVIVTGLGKVQAGMDEKERWLGLRCDEIGDELGALQLKRNSK